MTSEETGETTGWINRENGQGYWMSGGSRMARRIDNLNGWGDSTRSGETGVTGRINKTNRRGCQTRGNEINMVRVVNEMNW